MIVDTNLLSMFNREDNKDIKPVINWLKNKKGKIVYTRYGKYPKELDKVGEDKNFIKRLYLKENRSGRFNNIRLIEEEQIKRAERELQGKKIASNDRHILVLARAANTKLLMTGDGQLKDDFKHIIRGNIYKDSSHAHLLTPDTCLL